MCHICDPVGTRVTENNMIQKESITFGDLGVSLDLLKVLNAKKLIHPTPIQEKCISLGFAGKDIVGIAQTGTGKTLAFGLPAIEHIRKNHGKCIVMLPTRELAIQVNDVLSGLGRQFRIKTALLIGGVSSFPQNVALKKNPEIIIATPGRLIDHINRRNCDLRNVNFVVLDEADRMLDIGFMPQIREILKSIPNKRQTMLFSATIPTAISELSAQYMNCPTRIEASPSGTSAPNIKQEAYIIYSEEKQPLLKMIIQENNGGSVLVFTRTKYRAKKIASVLRQFDISAVEMHSNRSLAQRKSALDGFKSGKFQVLVATDVAARGLDIDDISLVVNLDLPGSSEDYVHRIGRTGRAGKSGRAVSFVEPNEKFKIKQIERLMKKSIRIIQGPQNLPRLEVPEPPRQNFARPSRPEKFEWGRNKKPSQQKVHSYGRNKKRFSQTQRSRKQW